MIIDQTETVKNTYHLRELVNYMSEHTLSLRDDGGGGVAMAMAMTMAWW